MSINNTIKKYLLLGGLALGIGLTTPNYAQENINSKYNNIKGIETQNTLMEFNILAVNDSIISGQQIKVYNNTTGQLLGETVLINSQATITITKINDNYIEEEDNNSTKIYGHNGTLHFENIKPAKITIYNTIGQEILSKNSENHETQINLNNIANAPYIILIQTNNKTETKKIIKNGQQLYFSNQETNKQKLTPTLKNTENQEYKIEITGQGIYKRTIITTQHNITDYVVHKVQQEGVTDSLFYELCKEANFESNFGYTGLKTYITQNNPNTNKIIIRTKGPPQKPFTVTLEDIQYIKNLIETEIYPYIKEENRPPIELRIENTHTVPIINPGEIIIYPGIGYNITSFDDNGDGIIDRNFIELKNGEYQYSIRNDAKLQEILSAFVAPNQVDGHFNPRFSYKTVLSSGTSARKLTAMDIRLLQLGQRLKPKTSIDEILGF